MDIQQIHYFLVLCQRLNYTKASRQLYISRQALSRSIRDLEKRFGEPLFISHRGDLELTPLGEYLRAHCAPVAEAYSQLELSTQEWLEKRKNRIQVAIGLGTINAVTPGLLTHFEQLHPEISLTPEEVTDRSVRELVQTGQVDLGLLSSLPAYLENFDVYPVQAGQIYLQVNQAHPLATRERIETGDLRGVPFVSLGSDCDLHNLFVEKCRQAGFEPRFALITQDSNVANSLVLSNQAISFGHIQTLYMTQHPAIRVIPLEIGSDPWGVYAILKQGREPTPAVGRLVQYFADQRA